MIYEFLKRAINKNEKTQIEKAVTLGFKDKDPEKMERILQMYVRNVHPVDEKILSSLCEQCRLNGEIETDLHTLIRTKCDAKAIEKLLHLRKEDLFKQNSRGEMPIDLQIARIYALRVVKYQSSYLGLLKKMDKVYNDRLNEMVGKIAEEQKSSIMLMIPNSYIFKALYCAIAYGNDADYDFIEQLICKGAYYEGQGYVYQKKHYNFSEMVLRRYHPETAIKIFDLLNEKGQILVQKTEWVIIFFTLPLRHKMITISLKR